MCRILLVLCGLGLTVACGQFPASNTQLARSSSGQFVIQAAAAAQPATALATNRNLLRLEPGLLTISCERIKQDLWRTLEISGSWRSRIFITLYPAKSADDNVMITADRFKDAWQYHVLAPDMIERVRYVRAMTQVVLLELANRSAGTGSAEIPTWLVEGLSRQLLASGELRVIIPAPTTRVNGVTVAPLFVDGRQENPLERAHKDLTAQSPLTFQQLSWPEEDQLAGQKGEFYRSNAQLFVDGLLRLEHGRACLRAFLAELPQHYNWQFAFLIAFQPHFSRPLEIERWWDLEVANFTGRDLVQTWPREESWRKLDEAIHSAVQVRAGANELPLHAQATLQGIIRDWNRLPQTYVLEAKLRDLELVRPRISPDLAPIVDEYRQAIRAYLSSRDRTWFPLRFSKKAAQRHAAAEALKQLDGLEAQRQALRPAPPAAPTPAQPALQTAN